MRLSNNYPIVAIIGDRGAGKTLTMRALAENYKKEGLNIYANFTMSDIDYTRIEFDDIVDFPEYLENGVIFLDEGHIGMDAYNFFSRKVKDSTKFMTQTRKRKLTIYFSTQIFSQVARRLRLLTNYIMECRETDTAGLIYISIFDRMKVVHNDGFIRELYLDGRPFFDKYDTDEIIAN